MKRQTWLLIAGLISLLVAAGGGLYAYRRYDALVTTATAVTVARAVPPYTALTPDLLVERDVPRGILREPIYPSIEELSGRIATTTLAPGQLIYRHQAVPPSAFRYAADPALEVVSFPVDPERAVGGQVQIGHRINVYRVQNKSTGKDIEPAASDTVVLAIGDMDAAAEVLAAGIPVVDVRARLGEPANRAAVPSHIEQSARPEATKPLQIITVAVDPATARSLVALAAARDDEIWVSLSPLATPEVDADE